MTTSVEERRRLALKARRWRDLLRAAPVVKLSAGQRAELAQVLDALQADIEPRVTEGMR